MDAEHCSPSGWVPGRCRVGTLPWASEQATVNRGHHTGNSTPATPVLSQSGVLPAHRTEGRLGDGNQEGRTSEALGNTPGPLLSPSGQPERGNWCVQGQGGPPGTVSTGPPLHDLSAGQPVWGSGARHSTSPPRALRPPLTLSPSPSQRPAGGSWQQGFVCTGRFPEGSGPSTQSFLSPPSWSGPLCQRHNKLLFLCQQKKYYLLKLLVQMVKCGVSCRLSACRDRAMQ